MTISLKRIVISAAIFNIGCFGASPPPTVFKVQERTIHDLKVWEYSGEYAFISSNGLFVTKDMGSRSESEQVAIVNDGELSKASEFESFDVLGNLYLSGKVENKFVVAEFERKEGKGFHHVRDIFSIVPPSGKTDLAVMDFSMSSLTRGCAHVLDHRSNSESYECIEGNAATSQTGTSFSMVQNNQYLYRDSGGVLLCETDASPPDCNYFIQNESSVCSTLPTNVKNFFVCASGNKIELYDKQTALSGAELTFEVDQVEADKIHLFQDYIYIFSNVTDGNTVAVNVYQRENTALKLKARSTIENMQKFLFARNFDSAIFATVVDGDGNLAQMQITTTNDGTVLSNRPAGDEPENALGSGMVAGIIILSLFAVVAAVYVVRKRKTSEPTSRTRSSTTVENLVVGGRVEQVTIDDTEKDTFLRRVDETVTVSQVVNKKKRTLVFEQTDRPELIPEVDRVLAEEDTSKLGVFFGDDLTETVQVATIVD